MDHGSRAAQVVSALSEHQRQRHDALYSKGWALTEGRLLLDDPNPAASLGLWGRWQLHRAARCFEQALAIHPAWQSMFALGKVAQRLGDVAAAFEWFTVVHRLQPDQPDVAREASLVALDLGMTEAALALCRAALAISPTDAGLMSNLALAHCLAGDDAQAVSCIDEALHRNPADRITVTARRFINAVASGQRPRPCKMTDAFPLA